MYTTDIPWQRLHSQHLLTGLARPDDVVRWMGAVQAQDFTGAKWAVGVRCKNATDALVSALYNEGKILRTHVLRSTWHFVAPEDIRWMLALTSPRVQALCRYHYRRLTLDDRTLKKGADVIARALQGGHHLTRTQVKAVLTQAGLPTEGLRLGFFIMYAELEGVVCSGAMQGKQHTIALLSERAPQALSLSKEEALATLATRFFTSHGPAMVQDLAWWSSLTVAEARKGAALAGLRSITVEGKELYYASQPKAEHGAKPLVHILPNYDEYVVAYKDRSAFMQRQLDTAPSGEALFHHTIVVDGQLVGWWKRSVAKGSFVITPTFFAQLSATQLQALEEAASDLQQFLGAPVVIA